MPGCSRLIVIGLYDLLLSDKSCMKAYCCAHMKISCSIMVMMYTKININCSAYMVATEYSYDVKVNCSVYIFGMKLLWSSKLSFLVTGQGELLCSSTLSRSYLTRSLLNLHDISSFQYSMVLMHC